MLKLEKDVCIDLRIADPSLGQVKRYDGLDRISDDSLGGCM